MIFPQQVIVIKVSFDSGRSGVPHDRVDLMFFKEVCGPPCEQGERGSLGRVRDPCKVQGLSGAVRAPPLRATIAMAVSSTRAIAIKMKSAMTAKR